MTLKQFIKNPKTRFKTMFEMSRDYGIGWMEDIMHLHPHDAVTVMAYYGGKQFYPSLIKVSDNLTHCFKYGPTGLLVHESMLTSCGVLKYTANGTVIRPGMIMRIGNLLIGENENFFIPTDLRNTFGVLVRVLKVNNPSEILMTGNIVSIPTSGAMLINTINIDKYCVATELCVPKSGAFIDQLKDIYAPMFVGGNIRAFELPHHLIPTTKEERRAYYSRG